MSIKFKVKAKFGNFVLKYAKFNKGFWEMRRRCDHKNRKMNEYNLVKVSFHHYGNILWNSNYFPFESMNDIIFQIVRDFQGIKIMILYKHDSHNEFAWDFETYQAWDCKTFFLIVEGLRVDSSCRDFADKEVQMRINEVGEQ